MSDLIRREDVIDELMALRDAHKADQFTGNLLHWTGIKAMLESIPSAEPERKTGKWIEYPDCLRYEGAYTNDQIACSECHHVFSILDNCTEEFDFCPNCGADMRGDR